MCAAMVDRNPEYPDYGRPMYDSNPQNDYGRPAYESYQQPGDYRRGQEYGQERYNPTSQYPGSSDPPVPDDLQITSGLVSLSDEKAKERRHLIQMEMRKEYEDHMRRQKPVYYTTGSVDDGLPIGNYAQARKVLDTERHRDYNKYMKEKEEQANRHRDEMVRQQHASPPHPANQTEMYDHNQMSQQLREERRKEYNDYLKLKENLEHESAGRPVTPPGGLALGGYEVYRNQLKKDRVREYRQSLLKQQNEQWLQRAKEFQLDTSPSHEGHLESERPLVGSPRNVIVDYKKLKEELSSERKNDYNRLLAQKEANGTPRAPPTPPVGLNIPTEAERHKIAELKKRQYRDELLRQQKEQILNRAQHQLEIPVIDRRQPNSDPPPLINPPQDRPPSGRWDPQSYRQSNFDQVKRVTSPPHQANIGHDDYGAFRRQTEHEVRNKEYNDFLAKKQHLEDEKKQKLADQRRQAPAPIVKGDYYDSEQYDRRRQALNDLQHREYQNYLKNGDPSNQTSAPHSYGTSLPMVESELKYNEFRKKQEKQRNWDYNVLLKHDQQRNRAPTPDHLQGLPLSQRQYDSMRKMQEKQRNQEYNDLLAKKGFNQHQPPETNRRPELGLKSEFQDQEPAGRQSQRNAPVGSLIAGDRVDYPSSANERFNRERRKDYNDYIKKTPPKERVKEFGSQGAVLFDPVYNKDVKNRMREERSKDLKDFLEKQEADRFRKQENTRPDNRIGFMTHLGRPVEEMREKLAKERHEEYNKYLKDKYISQPHQRPLERPKWVDSKLMEDNWQKEAAGSRSRPTSDKPIHTPTYEEMLDKKRREEASYRRFDDPEYSRSGADRGYDAQYRRYDQ
nr:trichohyalin isoform X42 [Crassostrea gigas]